MTECGLQNAQIKLTVPQFCCTLEKYNVSQGGSAEVKDCGGDLFRYYSAFGNEKITLSS
jgi:hypothetical protein